MRFSWLVIVLFVAGAALPARAQQPDQSQKPNGDQDSSSSSSSGQQPSDSDNDSGKTAHGKKGSRKAAPAPEDDAPRTKPVDPKDPSTWDPYHAYHDVDVGNFYKDKGDLDAAIGRYEDAIRLKPDFGKPRMLLAEIYEKRGDNDTALKYYKEYLQVYPDAPDRKKVEKKIEKLSSR
jgi:tetratricopeptide (TPR) repeat protein